MRQVFGRKQRDARRRWDERAWIALPGMFSLRECRILDISAGGAKLSIARSDRVPSSFNLISSPARREGRKCEVRWRHGSTMGVKFLD